MAHYDRRLPELVMLPPAFPPLHLGQPAVARLEQRADVYVSNLRHYIEALGGTLEITARFPDETSVAITNFGEFAASTDAVSYTNCRQLSVKQLVLAHALSVPRIQERLDNLEVFLSQCSS